MVDLAVGLGVFGGEPGDGLTAFVHIGVQTDAAPIGKGHSHAQGRVDELQIVHFFQLEVFHGRRIVCHRHVDSVGVVQEAGDGDHLCGQTSPYLISPVQKQDLQTGFGQIGPHRQPVRASTDDDPIVFCHFLSSFRL